MTLMTRFANRFKRPGRSLPAANPAAGFTIIEMLIVLAIAGLILLLVFEAIPTLERNSRNNQRKQDIQAVLEAVSHYELNNSGTFPGPCGNTSLDLCAANANSPLYYAKLTYYDLTTAGKVVLTPQHNTGGPPNLAADLPALSGSNATEEVMVYNYERCDPNTPGGATVTAAGYNDVVALYAIETGTNTIAGECQQL